MTAGPGDTLPTQEAPRPAPAGQDQRRKKRKLRGDIEGLRAVAVGTVLLYHVGIPFVPGGYVGVDVFFVISGFLITSLLLREANASGRISIADFYARRARRLLPAASVVLIFTAVSGWFVLPGVDRLNLGKDVVAATGYVINWALAFRSVDYLAEDAAPSALQHYWSLSVEEQFYVVWPLLIILGLFLAKRTRARVKPLLFAMLSLVAAASFVYSVVHTAADPATAYFYTTTRIWELAIGALLAFLVVRLSRLPKRLAELMAGVGLLLVIWSALALSGATPWPGYWALFPTVGAALVIAAGCATEQTLAGRLLGIKPMVIIGGLSYAIYLWHWPLIILAKAAYPDIRIRYLVLIGVLSIVFAWLTKHVVEDPIRFHPGLSAKASRGLLFGGATMLVSALAGSLVWASVPTVDPDAQVKGATALVADPASETWQVREDPQAVYTTSGAVTPDPAVASKDVPAYYDDQCQRQDGQVEVDTTCVYGVPDGSTTVALLGDSKMGQWFPAVNGIAGEEDWRVELYLKSACSFTYGGEDADCERFGHNVISHFEEHGAPDIALVSQGLSGTSELTQGMTRAIEDLEALGTKVVIVSDSPRPGESAVYACVEEHPEDFSACGFPAKDRGRKGTGTSALETLAKETDLPLINLNEWICPPGDTCPPVIAGTMVYRQGSHVTASYMRTLTPMLYRALAEQGLTQRSVGQISIHDIP